MAGHVLTKEQVVEAVWGLLLPAPGNAVAVHAEDEAEKQGLPEIRARVESLLAPIKDRLGIDLRAEFTNGTLRLAVQRKTVGDEGTGADTSRAGLVPDPLPIRSDANGDCRIGTSNVLLDTLVREFERGASPGSIAYGYDTLRLADVYAALSWYMNHKEEVLAYLKQREEKAAELGRRIEASQPPRPNFRKELLARCARMEQGHAAPAK